jgi:hypothetical protein
VEKEGSSSSGVDAKPSGVKRRRLLQIGGRTGENEGNGAGGSAWCHVEQGKQEKEREDPGHGGRYRRAKDAVGNGSRPSGAGGGAVGRTGESDGCGRRGAARLTGGAWWSTVGCGRKRGE